MLPVRAYPTLNRPWIDPNQPENIYHIFISVLEERSEKFKSIS